MNKQLKNIKITDTSKPRYIKKGKCNMCGDCCEAENCPYFKRKSKNKGICAVFNNSKKRYPRCYTFPDNPPIPFKRCSYYFIDTWNNNKIIKAGDPV